MSRVTKAQKQHRREHEARRRREARGRVRSRRTRQRREMPRRRERIALDHFLAEWAPKIRRAFAAREGRRDER